MKKPSYHCYKRHSHWLPLFRSSRLGIPREIIPWLSETDSLTSKLQTLGTLSIEVLFDQWGQTTQTEQVKLKLRPREKARVREVIIKLNDIPVVYARSIIPAHSLKGAWKQLGGLGSQPLGCILYKKNNAIRSKIEAAQLPVFPFSMQQQPLWTRRSIFHQYGHGILVHEAFTPELKTFLR